MNAFEQGLLRYLSQAQLQKLQRVFVGIAGVGGLGSNCAMLLVRAGFKRLLLVDFDVVEASNLNRQFFFPAQIGQAKVEALAENLRRVQPDLHLRCLRCKIEAANVKKIFAPCDILVEALDAPEAKAALLAAHCDTGKCIVAASGVAGFGNSDQVRTKRLGDALYIVGDFASDAADLPPFAPRVTLAAAKQADLVLAYVLGNR